MSKFLKYLVQIDVAFPIKKQLSTFNIRQVSKRSLKRSTVSFTKGSPEIQLLAVRKLSFDTCRAEHNQMPLALNRSSVLQFQYALHSRFLLRTCILSIKTTFRDHSVLMIGLSPLPTLFTFSDYTKNIFLRNLCTTEINQDKPFLLVSKT